MTQPDAAPAGDYTLEDCIIRFKDLPLRRSTFEPLDTKVAKYARERYSVVGRGAEGTAKGKKTAEVKDFSIVYVKLDPGKAIGTHAHATAEVFLPLTGRWEVGIHGETTILEPFDVIAVPPNVMHSLANVGTEPAFLMSVNAGGAGARFNGRSRCSMRSAPWGTLPRRSTCHQLRHGERFASVLTLRNSPGN